MKHAAAGSRPKLRQWLFLGLAIVGLYVVIPQLGSFKSSLQLLHHASVNYLLAALVATAGSYLAAAANYYYLSFKPLNYGRTVVVELGSMFANRLLPGGLGGISVNYSYLRKSKHSAVQAASVVTVNNLFGLIGHGLILAGLVALFHASLPPLHGLSISSRTVWLTVVIIVAICLGLIAWPLIRRRAQAAVKQFRLQLQRYRQQPLRLGLALASSMLITLSTVLSLWLAMHALQADLSFVAVFLVFSLGIVIGTATPTPGGLGGIEAGLIAGFVAYGLTANKALAIVLAYRLVSYWLPLIVGGIAFIMCQRKHYF